MKRIFLIIGMGLALFSAYAASEFYQAHLEQETLIRDTQGMTEYEVCQYVAKKFDMKMVKDMGCMNGEYVLNLGLTAQ